jgi:hypothetical protein
MRRRSGSHYNWTFEAVATEASEREVALDRRAVVLLRDDMINAERKRIIQLWHLAVFAAILGAFPNKSQQFDLHRCQDPDCDSRFNESLALA